MLFYVFYLFQSNDQYLTGTTQTEFLTTGFSTTVKVVTWTEYYLTTGSKRYLSLTVVENVQLP